jgi:hypothetical protein
VPTYQPRPSSCATSRGLTAARVAAWEKALDVFIAYIRSGRFEPGLCVKRVQGYPGVCGMTWAAAAL